MSLKSLMSRLKKTLPVIVANAPAVIAAVLEVKKAVKDSKGKKGESSA